MSLKKCFFILVQNKKRLDKKIEVYKQSGYTAETLKSIQKKIRL